MSSRFEQAYRVDGATKLTATLWNRIFREIDTRLVSIEEKKASFEEAERQLLQIGLDRINEALLPAAERIFRVAELGFLVASSDEEATFVEGQEASLTIREGDQRELFTPTEFVAISRRSTPEDWVIARTLGYSRESGVLLVRAEVVKGSGGPHDDWDVSATPGAAQAVVDLFEQVSSLRQEVADDKVAVAIDKAAAQSARTEAQNARDAAIIAKTGAESALASFMTVYRGALPSAPPDGEQGHFYFDTTLQQVRVRTASGWIDIAEFYTRAESDARFVRFDGAHGLTPAQQSQARANIGADVLGGFRNKIINGNFDIWQRGTSQTSDGYGSDDRWFNSHSGGYTKTHSRQSFTLGQTAVPGNPKYFSRTQITVAGSSASDYCRKWQRIEGVQTFAGKTVTVTFWAKADSNRNIAVELVQIFGTGGSPSSEVNGIGVTTCALTTSWQKFSFTASVPSISGKTLGSDGNDYLALQFWFGAGSNFNARTNSLGHQVGTFDIARVSLVEGDATAEDDPFSPRHIQQEVALCQRYFCKTYSLNAPPGTPTSVGAFSGRAAIASAGAGIWWIWMFPVMMRTIPTVTLYSPGSGAAGKIYNPAANTDISGVAELTSAANCFVRNNEDATVINNVYTVQLTAEAEL